jgi:hypothetical protein
MLVAGASASTAVGAPSWDAILGVPVHSLAVLAVVVLLPLAALGAIWMTVSRRASRRFAAMIVPISWIGVGACLIAEDSGWALPGGVGPVHASLADSLSTFALILAASITGFWLVDRGIPGNRHRPPWFIGAGICLDLLALAVIGWAIRIGYSGAMVPWSGS